MVHNEKSHLEIGCFFYSPGSKQKISIKAKKKHRRAKNTNKSSSSKTQKPNNGPAINNAATTPGPNLVNSTPKKYDYNRQPYKGFQNKRNKQLPKPKFPEIKYILHATKNNSIRVNCVNNKTLNAVVKSINNQSLNGLIGAYPYVTLTYAPDDRPWLCINRMDYKDNEEIELLDLIKTTVEQVEIPATLKIETLHSKIINNKPTTLILLKTTDNLSEHLLTNVRLTIKSKTIPIRTHINKHITQCCNCFKLDHHQML